MSVSRCLHLHHVKCCSLSLGDLLESLPYLHHQNLPTPPHGLPPAFPPAARPLSGSKLPLSKQYCHTCTLPKPPCDVPLPSEGNPHLLPCSQRLRPQPRLSPWPRPGLCATSTPLPSSALTISFPGSEASCVLFPLP